MEKRSAKEPRRRSTEPLSVKSSASPEAHGSKPGRARHLAALAIEKQLDPDVQLLPSDGKPKPGLIYLVEGREIVYREDGSQIDVEEATRPIREWLEYRPYQTIVYAEDGPATVFLAPGISD